MYLVNCTSDDFKEKVSKVDMVIIPIGSVEAHGHHLPLGTDIFSPRLFCKRIDEKIGEKIWIAPEIPYGQCQDMSIYPGTVTMPSEVLASYVFHIGKSLADNGIRKIIFMNGHGGNMNALNLACEKLMTEGIDATIINWWMDFSKEILTVTEGQGHGGEDETSAILYYDDNLVDMNKAMKNCKKPLLRVFFKDRGRTVYDNAISGDATLATKEKGEKIFEILEEKILNVIKIMQEGRYYAEQDE